MLRSIAERLSRGRAVRRSLPQVFGGCRMYVSMECGLRYWLGVERDNLLKNAVETVTPGNVVWDVGANMGLFSFAAAGLAGPEGRIYAFEPDTVLVSLLRRSSKLNPGAAPVETIPCAVSDVISLACFNIAERSRASNFLEGFGLSQTGGVRERHIVFTVPLDWMAERIPPPDVLKIDVEGAELSVFRGARRLLESKRPTVLFEAAGKGRAEIASLLWKLDYVLYDSDIPTESRRPLTEPAYNTLAVPV